MELSITIEHLKDALKIEYGENVLVNRECLKTVLAELDKRIPPEILKDKIIKVIKSNPGNEDWEEGEDYYITPEEAYVLEILGEIIGEEW